MHEFINVCVFVGVYVCLCVSVCLCVCLFMSVSVSAWQEEGGDMGTPLVQQPVGLLWMEQHQCLLSN